MTTDTQTTTPDTIDTIAAAIDRASGQWTGLDWQSDLDGLADRLARGQAVNVEDGIAMWIPTDGSHLSQTHRAALRRLADDIEAGDDDVAERARGLADEEREYVELEAASAADAGALAIEAARAGDLDRAVDHLRTAARLERAFGDAPAWGTPLAIAERLAAQADGTVRP